MRSDQIFRFALVLLATVVFAFVPSMLLGGEHAVSYSGHVEVVTLANGDIQVAVDEYTPTKVSDGFADHLFILQEPEKTAQGPRLTYYDAMVSHASGKLSIRHEGKLEMVWRLSSSVERPLLEGKLRGPLLFFGAGISRHTSEFDQSAESLATEPFFKDDPGIQKIIPDGGGGIHCDAGGIGAISCSKTCGGTGDSCSIECSNGKYACCNCTAGNSTCRCWAEPSGSGPPGGGG